LRLPSGVAQFGSTRQLFAETCKVISKFSNLSEDAVSLTSAFVFSSWLPERAPLAPFLFVNSAATAGPAAFLRLLDALSMHSIKLAEINAADLRSLRTPLRLTVLMDVAAPKPSLMKVLRASSRDDFRMLCGGKIIGLSCSKVLCSQEPLRDPAVLDFPLQIALAPTSGLTPAFDRQVAEKIAAEFQPKFLLHRLNHLNDASRPMLDVVGLTGPTQELAHTLAAGLAGDDTLCSRIVARLRQRDREIETERAAGVEAVVVEALLFSSHEGARSTVRAAELADYTNEILHGRAADCEVSPEQVGWRLKALGFHTESIGSAGKGLHLDPAVRTRIHRLARNFEVRSLQAGPRPQCAYCVAIERSDSGPNERAVSASPEGSPEAGLDV
jgi:hypothetical protein